MKKSNKKVKSDRINALRKQYDAFLEEDKKRKDRNELILDKLDKMRSCTATVPLRSIPTSHILQTTDIYSRYGNTLEKSSTYERYLPPFLPTHQLPIEIPRKQSDDATLLKEINKKYILIPKLSSAMVKKYPETLQSVTDPDSDWKSKYDILNKINVNDNVERECEKIDPIKEIYSENFKTKDSFILEQRNNEKFQNNYDPDIQETNQDSPVQFKEEKPEKDISDVRNTNELMHFEKHKQIKEEYGNYIQYADNKNQYENCETPNISSDISNYHEIKTSTADVGPVEAEFSNFSADPSEESCKKNDLTSERLTDSQILLTNVQSSDEPPQQKDSFGIIEQSYTQEPIVNAVETEILSAQHHNAESTEQIESQISAKDCTSNDIFEAVEDVRQNENIEYPIEIINVSESTPNESVELQDKVNVNPHLSNENPSHQHDEHIETVVEHTENDLNDASGIEEFNAEQNNMFYSEQPSENYAYDQTSHETAYQEYEQNANYEQNEEYAYYENVQPEQTYPAEINEFEETTQPYDQTYQEQYAAYDQKNYEQQEVYEQQQEHYEGLQDIDSNIQPETEHLQYEQSDFDPQVIEEQLDNEEGYTKPQDSENTQNLHFENPQDLDTINNSELQNSEIQ